MTQLPHRNPDRATLAIATLSLGIGLFSLTAVAYGYLRGETSTPGAEQLMAVAEAPRVAEAAEAGHLIRFVEAPEPVVEPTPAVPAPSLQVAPSPADVDATAVLHQPVHAGPTFDGRPLRKARTITMTVTAYSPDARSCGKWADGQTASGYSVWTNGMKLVAADTRILPFGSIITVPGYNGGQPVPVLDRGGAIKGNRLDVLYPTHEIARRWGRQKLQVTVWEYAD